MKRLILATLMVLMVAGILGMVSAQDTCPARPDGATRTDLLAGQTTNIGNVWVWNDDEFVYVQYDITVSGWYLTETHADVRCDWTLIPQNTNHNPEPGHFAKKESFAVTSHTTTWCTKIPMPTCAAECNHELAVAAHAAVVQLKETCSDVVSGTAVTTVTQRRSGDALVFSPVNLPAIDAWEPGSRYPNDGLDDSAWQANSLWDQQIYGKGIDTNIADWIWETYLVQDPVLGTALTMTTPLFNGYPVSGDLYITCDNGYQAFVNGQSVGSANVAPGFQTSDLKQASVDTNGWQSVQHYDLAPFLVSGPNTLTIDAANEYLNPDDPPNTLTGTVSNNPGACIFQAPVCYETIKRTETAWGAGTRFTSRGNWATWITYYPGCIVRYPPSGNVYIGYEDWGQGDYDYNDFGMKASFEEEYIGGLTNAYLQKITMHFVPVIYDSGMNHLIHIKRTDLVGSFDGEVTHPGYVPDILTLHDGSTGAETAPGTSIGLTGDLDVVLFNTAKYSWPEKIPAFGTEEVTVVVTMTSPTSNPKIPYTTADLEPRSFTVDSVKFFDLDPFLAPYDPWEMGTLYTSEFHLIDTQVIGGSTSQQNTPEIMSGITVPYILVIPYTDWIPPFEDTTITGPYEQFNDFYDTGIPVDWYTPANLRSGKNVVGKGALSFGPYILPP